MIVDLKKCDFRDMHAFFMQQSEDRKNRSKEEKLVGYCHLFCLTSIHYHIGEVICFCNGNRKIEKAVNCYIHNVIQFINLYILKKILLYIINYEKYFFPRLHINVFLNFKQHSIHLYTCIYVDTFDDVDVLHIYPPPPP